MNDSPDTLEAAATTAAESAPADETWGWYLYGITRAAEGVPNDLDATMQVGDEGEPLEAVPSGRLLAVVRRVSRADFSPDSLSAQVGDPAWIEAIARRHNAVVEAVHRTRTILPAKFGSVYASAEDVRTAMRQEHDALQAALDWLDSCDEWGVRLYGDIAILRQRADAEQEGVRRLRQDLASASPGRAYFLRRKLADEVAGARDQLLDYLVEQAYAHCARHAQAGQVSRRMANSRITQDAPREDRVEEERVEIVRAAFLVRRESAEAFIEDVRRFAESQVGLSCDYSGPWPPYSFASQATPIDQSEPRAEGRA